MKDLENVGTFINLRARGVSYAKISKKLKICKQTLINWGKEFKLIIHNKRTAQLETLYEKFGMQKDHKIKLYGQTLKSIRKELKKRDLSRISTEKLMELMIKYSELLENEINDCDFISSYNIVKKGVKNIREDPIYTNDEDRPQIYEKETPASPPPPVQQPPAEQSPPSSRIPTKPELDRFFTETNLPPIPLPEFNYTPTPS